VLGSRWRHYLLDLSQRKVFISSAISVGLNLHERELTAGWEMYAYRLSDVDRGHQPHWGRRLGGGGARHPVPKLHAGAGSNAAAGQPSAGLRGALRLSAVCPERSAENRPIRLQRLDYPLRPDCSARGF
jgi:hypothetical protein